MMIPDYLSVEADYTVGETISYIRRNGIEKEIISLIFVVDLSKKLIGTVLLKELLNAPDETLMRSLMKKNPVSIQARDNREKSLSVFETYDMPALPVTDGSGVLIGIVTFDDMHDVAKEEATEDIQKSSAILPLEFRYFHTSPFDLFKKRVGWLLFLLTTSFLSSSVIAYFSGFMSLHVALSYFIPVLIGAGGNTGSQSATLVIRSLSIGEFPLSQWWKALRKELLVGLWLGLALAIFMFFYSQIFVRNSMLGAVVACAMLFVVLWANLVGAMLPLFFSRLKLDPAVISSPFLSTLVDATGLVIYFLTAMAFFKLHA
jgi:magnesium transporter